MAPEIALGSLQALEPGSAVVDPMCGSGLVLREVIQQGPTPFLHVRGLLLN